MNRAAEHLHTPLLCSSRLNLSIFCFFTMIALFAQRSNLSVLMVCMVNQTALDGNSSNYSDFYIEMDNTCKPNSTDSSDEYYSGPFEWSKTTQGLILGSFYWGYLVSEIPGGLLSQRFGAKIVFFFGMAGVTAGTLLTPIVATLGSFYLILLRIFMGLAEGVIYPCLHYLWARWAPVSERSTLIAISFAGVKLGDTVAMATSGIMCEQLGWEVAFYAFGGVGAFFCLIWLAYVHDTPAQSKRINGQELLYIERSLSNQNVPNRNSAKVPWKSVLTSAPVWAIIVSHTCMNFGQYLGLTEMPTFMAEILDINIAKNGLYSGVPYIAMFIVISFAGVFADLLRKHCLRTTTVRKIFAVTALLGSAAFQAAVGYISCHQVALAVILWTFATAIGGLRYGGQMVNHVDIAPRYAGALMGLTNMVATIPGIAAPYMASALTPNQTIEEWREVFWITSGILAFGAVVYVLLGSGEVQSWALQAEEVEEETVPLLGDKLL